MGKKVNWDELKSKLEEIFGADEVTYNKWQEKEIDSRVLDFLTGVQVRQLNEANIELLAPAETIPYDDCTEGGDKVTAVFALEDTIYAVTLDHYSYRGFDMDYATAKEVAPKIKQIIYYE